MRAATRLPLGPLLAAVGAEDPIADEGAWIDVCALDDIGPGGAVCALVRRHHVAIFRPAAASQLFALDNVDPFSNASVLSRGIMGDRDGILKIASPIFKQSFDLRTGVCLDDPAVRVATFAVRISGGRVEVRAEPRP